MSLWRACVTLVQNYFKSVDLTGFISMRLYPLFCCEVAVRSDVAVDLVSSRVSKKLFKNMLPHAQVQCDGHCHVSWDRRCEVSLWLQRECHLCATVSHGAQTGRRSQFGSRSISRLRRTLRGRRCRASQSPHSSSAGADSLHASSAKRLSLGRQREGGYFRRRQLRRCASIAPRLSPTVPCLPDCF